MMWSLLENLMVAPLVHRLPIYYETLILITVFIRPHYSTLKWARKIQFLSSHPIWDQFQYYPSIYHLRPQCDL